MEEETGLVCRLGDAAGQVDYRDRKGRPKVVRYWTMQPVGSSGGQFAPNVEVDQLRWMPLAEAGPALTYAHDRQILRSVKPEL